MFKRESIKITTVGVDSIGSTTWTFSRFFAAFIIWLGLKPRWVLLFSYSTMMIWSAVCLKTRGTTSLVFNTLFWFSAAMNHPIIYAISMRGLGVHAKTASCFMASTTAVGVMAYIARYALVLDRKEPNSFILCVSFLSAGMIFPLYLNLVTAAKRQVDPTKDEYLKD